MPSNVSLFLVLVAGFLFSRSFRLTRLASLSWDGPRLVFWAGVSGSILFTMARLVVVYLEGWRPRPWSLLIEPTTSLKHAVSILLPLKAGYSGTLIGTLVLALTIPVVLNLLIRTRTAAWITARVHLDGIPLLIAEELGTGNPVAITMDDSKVYVGFVVSHSLHKRPLQGQSTQYMGILPTLSGYRTVDTRELLVTTNYGRLVERVRTPSRQLEVAKDVVLRMRPEVGERGITNDDVESFAKESAQNLALIEEAIETELPYTEEELQVILPMHRVLSARRFDADVYTELFEEEVP